MKKKGQLFKIYGMQQMVSNREVHSYTILLQVTRKIPSKEYNSTPKKTRKRTNTIQRKEKKENI